MLCFGVVTHSALCLLVKFTPYQQLTHITSPSHVIWVFKKITIGCWGQKPWHPPNLKRSLQLVAKCVMNMNVKKCRLVKDVTTIFFHFLLASHIYSLFLSRYAECLLMDSPGNVFLFPLSHILLLTSCYFAVFLFLSRSRRGWRRTLLLPHRLWKPRTSRSQREGNPVKPNNWRKSSRSMELWEFPFTSVSPSCPWECSTSSYPGNTTSHYWVFCRWGGGRAEKQAS